MSQIDDTSKVDARSIFNFLVRVYRCQYPTTGRRWAFVAAKDGDRWRNLAPIDWSEGGDEDHLRAIIRKYASDHDFYFCPTMFKVDRRKKSHALPTCWLHCDIDGGDPNDFERRPSVMWETSPRRYQGLWLMPWLMKPSHAEACNRALAQYSDDGSGWDVTKMLRVPYTFNFKPEYHRPKVRLLKLDLEPICFWEPERVAIETADTGGGGVDWGAARALDTVALKRKFVRIVMAMNAPARDGDRSATWMWQAGLMRDAGASDEEIAALLTLCRKTFADKFPRGLDDPRARDEIERLCSKLENKK